MRKRRFGGLHLLLPLAFAGCTIYLGPYEDDTGGTANPSGEVVSPEEAQQAREAEAWAYTANVIYKGGEILYSFELPSGDILDFIKRDTLPALPYDLPPLPLAPEDQVLPAGVEVGLTELEQIPELLELAATATPFHRPTFWPYILGETDATSIEDYLARYQEGGQLSSVDRLYAGLDSPQPNRGMSAFMNQFRPEVMDQNFSLIELTVYCPDKGTTAEQIGIVISVDKLNHFGMNRHRHLDGHPRLHIEYMRTVNGNRTFVWDELDGEFVGNPFRRHQPGEKVPFSVVGGAQIEHLMAIFQAPGTGDWWIMYNGDLLGYYPATLFTMLNGNACGSAWYGEVFNPNRDPRIKTEMGSGKFAETGMLNAAYVRNPTYYDLSWWNVEPEDDLLQGPYEPLCYDRSQLWEGVLFLGGPGGKNPGCKWP